MELEEASWDSIADIWERSRSNWHWPQLPAPRIGVQGNNREFPFENYQITLSRDILKQGTLYIENLFDHLIVHYIFCPRSLETAGYLALAAIKGLKDHAKAKSMVNIFSDIIVDSFRLERSSEDEEKVLLGWRRLAGEKLSDLDRIVIGFLAEYWGMPLPRCDRPEIDLLLQVYSPGVRDRSLWSRQCQQTARILEPFMPGILGKGNVRSMEVLNGSAHSAPMAALACELEPGQYAQALAVLGLKGDLKRWYRDQSYFIEIRHSRSTKESCYPSGLVKWRHTDPLSDLDVAFSFSMSPVLIPGMTTYKRDRECCRMNAGREMAPDLLVVLDSSKSMNGHGLNTKTHKATLAAFKACQFAHQQGAEVAAINFSEKFYVQPWTRDLGAVEDALVEYICTRTHIPGRELLELARMREGCLILCITDTHIQNLYMEFDYIKEAAQYGDFVLFCIDQAGRDKYVENALRSLGQIYYIDKLDDLVKLVVSTAEQAYMSGESFIS
ncbi:MAG: VWA domain-containing protein [Methanotrichaceae archaeon]